MSALIWVGPGAGETIDQVIDQRYNQYDTDRDHRLSQKECENMLDALADAEGKDEEGKEAKGNDALREKFQLAPELLMMVCLLGSQLQVEPQMIFSSGVSQAGAFLISRGSAPIFCVILFASFL